VPDRGDIIWLTLSPQAGHEQAERRPVIVLSPAAYNERVGLALCCPITSRITGYPFEVHLPDGLPVAGVTLADQGRSLDWRARQAMFIVAAPPSVITEVVLKASALLE
jgi:mRNA interferase MazF